MAIKNFAKKISTSKTFYVLLWNLLIPAFVFAQESVPAEEMNMQNYVKYWFLFLLVFVGLMFWLVFTFGTKEIKPGEQQFSIWKFIKGKLSNAVPVENENEIMLDDDYDGIKELNNKVPPWFNILFYGSIVFAFIYFFYYHVFDTGKLQIEEYQEEVAAAELQKEILFRSGKLISEENVTFVKDAGSIQNGKTIYTTNCAVCHGQNGEGLVGPNLADEYWIHGNKITDVFKVIKYGVPAKGMIAWQSQLNPQQMQEVASFVLTLEGTNPANPKQPEGEKMAPATDSTAAAQNSNT